MVALPKINIRPLSGILRQVHRISPYFYLVVNKIPMYDIGTTNWINLIDESQFCTIHFVTYVVSITLGQNSEESYKTLIFETNFNEIVIHTFSWKEMYLKMSSAKWWPSCFGLNMSTSKRMYSSSWDPKRFDILTFAIQNLWFKTKLNWLLYVEKFSDNDRLQILTVSVATAVVIHFCWRCKLYESSYLYRKFKDFWYPKQACRAWTTKQVYKACPTKQVYRAWTTKQVYRAWTTKQVYRAWTTKLVYRAWVTKQVYRAWPTNLVYRAWTTKQV